MNPLGYWQRLIFKIANLERGESCQAVLHGPAWGETRAPAQSLVLCSLPKPAMGIVPGGSVTDHGLERSHLEGR